ncbi:MAG: hypothetical protein GEU93_18165 [Propionibacteriales bacterium]|nr:hypothetical protein [Propionibacteriales bacterium]
MIGVPSPSYADPDPTLDQVEARVEKLYHDSEQAQERLNAVKDEMAGKQRRLRVLRADLAKQRRESRDISEAVAGMIADQAQGADASLSPTQQLIFTPG